MNRRSSGRALRLARNLDTVNRAITDRQPRTGEQTMYPIVQHFSAESFLAELTPDETVRVDTYTTTESNTGGSGLVFVHLSVGTHATALVAANRRTELHSLWLPTLNNTVQQPFLDTERPKIQAATREAEALAQWIRDEATARGCDVRPGRYELGQTKLVQATHPEEATPRHLTLTD